MKISHLSLLIICFFIFSCNADEELFAEALAENSVTEENGDEAEGDDSEDEPEEEATGADVPDGPEAEPEGALEINSTPCEYSLMDVLEPNGDLLIDCQIDLEGQTINLPSNVTLNYNGGEIINGKLVFNGGYIDGNLLNQYLELEGEVMLVDPVFQFHPERWDFVQGQTNSDRAQENNFNLEGLFFMTKDLGATTFVMGEFDAYFEISKVTSTTTNQNFYPTVESINLPSNFNLQMSESTVLRTFPNSRGNGGALIGLREISNTSISGGVLVGDRDEHDYSGSNPGEGGNHLLYIHGADNIVVDGVKMTMGSAGGLVINSVNFTFQSNYVPSNAITIRNCIFEDNRRMATAITDGFNMVVENNTYRNTALDRANSDGGVVGFAINLEAVRTRDESGNLVYYERVYNITFNNNIESGSRVGALSIYTGENIVVENNEFESKLVYSYASDSKIRNNNFSASASSKSTPAVNALGEGETVFNNEIYGNRISGYDISIAAYNKDIKIYDNILENFKTTGIQLKQASDIDIFNNVFTSNQSSSYGIMAHLTSANNVNIYSNQINVKSSQVYFVSMNQDDPSYMVNVYDNSFDSDTYLTFSNANGINMTNNDVTGGLNLSNVTNMDIQGNSISATDRHGVFLKELINDVMIADNGISVNAGSNYQCIQDNSTQGEVEISSTNICN